MISRSLDRLDLWASIVWWQSSLIGLEMFRVCYLETVFFVYEGK